VMSVRGLSEVCQRSVSAEVCQLTLTFRPSFNLTAVVELCADPSVAPTGEWATISATDDKHAVSSVVSWCKSSSDVVDLSVPGAFLAHDLTP